jgi:cell division protein FtsW (lipid II flippase)
MLFEVIGWLGTITILLAYFLVSTKRLVVDDKRYHLLNAVGATGIIINSAVHGAIPPTVLNIVWLLIAVYGLIKASGK